MAAKHQMHGKSFENLIKTCGLFSYAASDRKRSPGEKFDIAAGDDFNCGRPTSVKSAKGKSVALSDARRFWRSFDEAPYRVLICKYEQIGNVKTCGEIYEFILQKEHRAVFFGDVKYEEIAEFHENIGLARFPEGRHADARQAARRLKNSLKHRLGILVLNPKIDSGKQRRLQCSAGLEDLTKHFGKPDTGYRLHIRNIGDLLLPLRIISARREFNK